MSYSVQSCLRISNFHNKLIICLPHKLSIITTSVKFISHTVVQSFSQVDPFLVLVLFKIYIQSRAKVYIRLINKPFVNKVTLTGQNASLEYCQCLEILTAFEKDQILNAENLWSVGQRAANLSAVKFEVSSKSLPLGTGPT